jgi:hypothetical protein
MKGKALLFGLNYSHCKDGKLNGCINDVRHISNQLKALYGADFPTEIYTDDFDQKNTSYDGIIKNLYNLAIESYRDNLEFVWVHYSGHGSYQRDTSGDELDFMDEGLVPSDYESKGILIDDILNHVISRFNPNTKILFVCDSCHSGSILDLKYTWNVTTRQSTIDNKKCTVKAKTILISGCMDNQTSADAYNLLNDKQHIGALTACFIKVLERKPQQLYDVFSFVDSVRKELKIQGFAQYPCLTSTFDIANEPSMILPMKPSTKPLLPPAPKMYNRNIPNSVNTPNIPMSSAQDSRYYEANNTYMRSISMQQNTQQYVQPNLQPYYPPPVYITYIQLPLQSYYM